MWRWRVAGLCPSCGPIAVHIQSLSLSTAIRLILIHTSHLDRRQHITAWRLLHGKLFVGAFSQHIRRADPAGHSCPHSGCESQPATFTHVFINCPWQQGCGTGMQRHGQPSQGRPRRLAARTCCWQMTPGCGSRRGNSSLSGSASA